MGILIRQEENGELWIMEIKEKWTIHGEQLYQNLTNLLKRLYINHKIQFNIMEEYVFTIENEKVVSRDKIEFYSNLTELVNWKAEGVGSNKRREISGCDVSMTSGFEMHPHVVTTKQTPYQFFGGSSI